MCAGGITPPTAHPIHPCRVYHRTITPPPLTTVSSSRSKFFPLLVLLLPYVDLSNYSPSDPDPVHHIVSIAIAIATRTHGTDAGRHCWRCLQVAANRTPGQGRRRPGERSTATPTHPIAARKTFLIAVAEEEEEGHGTTARNQREIARCFISVCVIARELAGYKLACLLCSVQPRSAREATEPHTEAPS
jgi:hypothetical protein